MVSSWMKPPYAQFYDKKMNITREQLKAANSEAAALAVYHAAQAENDFIGLARGFMHDEDYQVARNALWGLTKTTDGELRQLQPLLHELIDLAMTASNSSVRRLALNVAYRLELAEEDLRTDFLDFCLEHMADVNEYPGIQSLCMKFAYRMATFYPELMGELRRTVEAMDMEYYKPAVRSVRNRIMRGTFQR